MTPWEVLRYARNINRLDADRYREKITLEYMNAALQRAKKMPALKSLLGRKQGPPSKASIVARIKEAAAFNNLNPKK